MTDLNPYEEGLALGLQGAKIRIKALQKALKDQSSVSDRLAEQLATCEKYRDAYDEMGRIGTQAVRDLEDKLALMVFERDEVIKFERDEARDRAERAEAKLAKAVELLEAWGDVAVHCSIEEGVCCCGDNMENHTNPMDCGHTPLDHGTYIAIQLAEETRATLAAVSETHKIKGETHDPL